MLYARHIGNISTTYTLDCQHIPSAPLHVSVLQMKKPNLREATCAMHILNAIRRLRKRPEGSDGLPLFFRQEAVVGPS